MEAGLRSLGFNLERRGEDLWVATKPSAPGREVQRTVDVNESGTALRLLTSVAAVTPGEFELTGRPGLLRRPIGELTRALAQLGAELHDRDGCPPVCGRGQDLSGGDARVDAARSSQFVSSLMLIGPLLTDGLNLETTGAVASPGYLELTRRVLADFGVQANLRPRADSGLRIEIPPGPLHSPGLFEVEGDWSAAGAFTLLAELCGGQARSSELRDDSLQPDRRFGETLAQLRGPGPRKIDVGSIPDQTMNLAVAAALREGTTEFVGAANLRLKESDRLGVTVRELLRLGGQAEVTPDGLRITGGVPLHGGQIDPDGDHRMAMAFAILGAFVERVEIGDPGCVAKSFPGFFTELDRALATRRCLALVGMRAVGKTTLGRSLAERLGLQFIDTDQRFEQAHGSIQGFVSEHGWPAFRELEAAVVRDALGPGRVVSTGGGAPGTPGTPELLRSEAFVLHLDATDAQLANRMARDPNPRPAVTDRSPLEELADLHRARRPGYLACSNATLPPSDSPEQGLEQALTLLRSPRSGSC